MCRACSCCYCRESLCSISYYCCLHWIDFRLLSGLSGADSHCAWKPSTQTNWDWSKATEMCGHLENWYWYDLGGHYSWRWIIQLQCPDVGWDDEKTSGANHVTFRCKLHEDCRRGTVLRQERCEGEREVYQKQWVCEWKWQVPVSAWILLIGVLSLTHVVPPTDASFQPFNYTVKLPLSRAFQCTVSSPLRSPRIHRLPCICYLLIFVAVACFFTAM